MPACECEPRFTCHHCLNGVTYHFTPATPAEREAYDAETERLRPIMARACERSRRAWEASRGKKG